MPAKRANIPTIPIAQAGPITDIVLERIVRIGMDVQQHDRLDDDGAATILLTAPQIARELLHRRRAMETIADMTDLSNVRFLPADKS